MNIPEWDLGSKAPNGAASGLGSAGEGSFLHGGKGPLLGEHMAREGRKRSWHYLIGLALKLGSGH